jgi:hypothetical protein
LATLILAHFISGSVVCLVDATLGRQRAPQVAFGGILLDPVLPSERHKSLRFGVNRVIPGITIPIPLRADRSGGLNVPWRLSSGVAGCRVVTPSKSSSRELVVGARAFSRTLDPGKGAPA